MQTVKVLIKKLRCDKCGYEWEPMVTAPKKCPKCQHTSGTKIKNKLGKAGVVPAKVTAPASNRPAHEDEGVTNNE